MEGMIKIFPLMTLLSMTLGLATEYKVTPIPSSSGIIFHNLGLAKISNQHFTLLSYINLTHIEEKIRVIKDYYSVTLSTCHIAINDQLANECFNQMKYIQKKLETIQKSFNIITHKINIISKRRRRGLMNAVGTGIKWLFGTPDSNDAQFYSDSINSLINNEKQTEVLMQQQVNIISDTITNFNNSLTRMNENINILNKNLKGFSDFQQNMITIKNSFEIEIGLSNHIILLIEMTDELTNQLNEYVNDISLISNNIISYNILPPETLYSELLKISTKQDLPLPLSIENIFIFYKLLEMRSFINKGLLVLSFDIPIVSKGKYQIYEILSAPVPHREDPMLFSYIEPNTPYILISKESTNYYNLNTLEKCIEILPNHYLCRHLYTMRKTNNNDQCEIILFNEKSNGIPKTCKIQNFIAELEIWHKLRNNQWFYSLSYPTQLSIVCDDKSTKVEQISKIGLFELNPKCKAFTKSVILEVQGQISTIELMNILPFTDINEDDCCKNLKKNLTLEAVKLEPLKLSNLDLTELKYAKHKLSEFDEQLQNQLNKPFIIKHTNWFTTILLIIAFIIIIIITYKCLKFFGFQELLRRFCCKSNRNNDKCPPCLQIFNNCITSQKPTHEFSVSFKNQKSQSIESDLNDESISLKSLRRSQRLKNVKISTN